MLNKKNKYIDVDMWHLQFHIRTTIKKPYFDYKRARKRSVRNYYNGFIIAKKVLQSELLRGLYDK